MKLEDQVVSPLLAKRLEELEVKRESYFYWYGGNVLRENQLTQELRRHQPPVSAYTVAELGEMLPEKVCFRNYQKRSNNAWRMNFGDVEFGAQTEADMKAKMLIYLLENKLITF